MPRKTLGTLIALAGLGLLAASALADVMGFGETGFGPNQVRGTIGGGVLLIFGILLVVSPQREA